MRDIEREKTPPPQKTCAKQNKRLFTLLDLRGRERGNIHSNCAPGNPRMTKERKREGSGNTSTHKKKGILVTLEEVRLLTRRGNWHPGCAPEKGAT